VKRLVVTAALAFAGATLAHVVVAQASDWPAPGTYALPPIQRVPVAAVLDTAGASRPLAAFTTGRITLLTFMYTYCSDPQGCPLAYKTFVDVRDRLAADPALAKRVRLVSLSFDPTHDTPAALRAYGGKYLADDAPQWRFLTTRSVKQLVPLLDALGQDVAVETDARGRATRTINHMLKVFLIDPAGRVREIYSVDYLRADVIENDIRTLAMERSR
jgi:protein SCO1